MPHLIVYLPAHGYSDDNPLFVSWLNDTYYVADKTIDSFKLVTEASGSTYVDFTTSITSGYVRQNTGSGSATITGLDHLEGEIVQLTSGGEFIGSYTVTSGSITAPISVENYQVGLPYTMKIKTTRLEVPVENATTQSKIKRVHEVVTRLLKTKNGSAGQQYGGTEYLTDMNADFSTSSTDHTVLAKGGYSEDGYTVVKSDEPYPMTVIATIVSFSVDEN